jgi:Pyridoxamine 5'-phosphate oxidase
MSWAAFAEAAPELARAARGLIERPGFVYVGTVRPDGAPRISPVEAHLVREELMLVMIASSLKARDVARDPRVTLQSPVTDPADPGAELKLRGRVADVDEPQRVATADAVEAASGWRPRPSWRFLAVQLRAVAVLEWDQGEMALWRWDRERGVRPVSRRHLDADASAYRAVE